jgi:hypothetical protein
MMKPHQTEGDALACDCDSSFAIYPELRREDGRVFAIWTCSVCEESRYQRVGRIRPDKARE